MRDRDGGAGVWLLNVVKTGAGKQTIVGANVSYTGATAVNQGTLSLIQTTAYNSPTTVAAGATLELGGTGDVQNNQIGSTIALAGNLNRITNASWLVWNGKVSPTAATAALNLRNDGANPGAGVGWIFLDGGLGSSGSQTLTINHTASDGTTPNNNLATVLRNNNSTYTGSLVVNNGSLVIAGGAAVTGTQLANADVTLNNATLQFASVFASTQNGANQLKSVTGNGTVSLGGTALSIGFNNGSGSYGGVMNGTGSLTKVGSGTITLAGANTFSGTTTINSGVLKLDYSLQDNSKLSDATRTNNRPARFHAPGRPINRPPDSPGVSRPSPTKQLPPPRWLAMVNSIAQAASFPASRPSGSRRARLAAARLDSTLLRADQATGAATLRHP